MKKQILLLLLVCSVLPVVFPEGNQDKKKSDGISKLSPPGVFPIVAEKATFSLMVPERLGAVPDWKTNGSSVLLEKLTNVAVEYQVVPSLNEARTLAIASGDMPDAILGIAIPPDEIMKYGPMGIYIPLNTLISAHAPNIKALFAEEPWIEKAQTTPNGKIYGLPMINDDLHSKFGTKLWINQEWLKVLGLGIPRTTEELYQVLKAFKTKDPNGNGKADEIPLSGYNAVSTPDSNVFCSGFLYPMPAFDAENYGITMDKGKVDFGFNKTGFRDAIKYAHRLHAEGLFDQSSFTQNLNQLIQLGEKPEAAVLGAGLVGFWSQMTINGGASGRYKLYSLVPPLKGPKGYGQVSYTKNNMRRDTMVITSAAKQPEIIVKWIDYFFSTEGSRNITYGPKDLGWREGKPGEIGLNGKPALFDRLNVAGDSAVAKNLAWGFFPFPRNQDVDERLGEVRSNDYYDPVKIMTRLTGEVLKQYTGAEIPDEMYFPPVYMTPEQAKESITIRTNLMSYVKESSALFILGDKDIDKDWDKYVEEIEKIGVKRYVQIFQDAYNSQYKK